MVTKGKMDVIAWLKKDGPGYQTKVNRLLRAEMLRSCERKTKRKGNLAEFLMASPLRGSGIDIKPLRIRLRKVDL
ncbi:MAG TPA: BrnA antitoxin family protein [Candidatus Angelobacter sp.]